ncbi:MAG TPA: hypothetical protein VH163_11560 [Gemmatimonadales bacterium]|jgi:hypothetical protein|nr:hypothetical protein [Gemmatimonadales bacterium]
MISYGTGVLVQVVTVPPPPSVEVLHSLVPLFGIVGVAICVAFVIRWVVHSPVGDAIAESIRLNSRPRRHWKGKGGEWESVPVDAMDEPRVAELEHQVQQLSGQVTELVERLDFTERVLAETRGLRELKPGR